MSQLIPVFSYIFTLIFFKENLQLTQIIGAIIMILSSIFISINFTKKGNNRKIEIEKDKKENKNLNTKMKNTNDFKALIFMTLSSLVYSLYFICFDFAVRNSEYNSVAFWYQIGLLLVGIIFLLFKSYRKAFVKMIKENGKKFVSLNIVNEVINLIANLLVNFASTLIPLALANTLSGFQGAFCFIIGIIGTTIFPKIISEEKNKNTIIQKISCIILGILGLIIMMY